MRLPLGLQDPSDGGRSPRPVRGFYLQLLPAGARQPVVLRAPGTGGLLPLGVEPSGTLQAAQRRQERAGIDLEHAARHLLDAAGNAESVHRLEAQRLENEHVERALNDVGVVRVHASTARAWTIRYRAHIL